jgi:hypothetical protein
MAVEEIEELDPGEWVTPIKKGYENTCCDCGLTHVWHFRLNEKGEIQFRVWRKGDEPASITQTDSKKKPRKKKHIIAK